MFRKKLLIVMSVLLIMGMFAACGSKTDQNSGKAEPKGTKPTADEAREVKSPDDFHCLLQAPDGTEVKTCYILLNKIDELVFSDEKGNEYTARATGDAEIGKSREMFVPINGKWSKIVKKNNIRYAFIKSDADTVLVALWEKKNEDGSDITYYCLFGPKKNKDKIKAYAQEMSAFRK